MRILITGIPGVGKSEIARELSKQIKYKIINDKKYSQKHKLGQMESKEYNVDIKKLNEQFSKDIKQQDNVIFEGHLWCELSKANLKFFDKVFILTVPTKILRERLEKRKYTLIKIEENIFCKENKYIENQFDKKKQKYIMINTNNNLKENIKKLKGKLW
ncbi:MAG: AAA family ATPase [archaeon]|jgi:adenylate kinase